MKHWLTRLFGSAGHTAQQPASTSSAPSAPAGRATAAHKHAPRALDLAFQRWLTDPVRGDASPAAEAAILAGLERLAADPAAAAALVPRVPAVVPQLLRSLRDDSVSGSELARQIARDAVLVAEVIRDANSPWFRSGKPVTTIDGAVRVLGENGLRILLARVAFRPIVNMQGGRVVRAVAPRLWQQSDACALAASLIAPDLGADPFEAYLAGLVLNVGLMAACRLIDHLEQPLVPQSDAFCTALQAHARELSAGIASHWEMPPFVAAAVVRAGRPGTQPLAACLGQADALAQLRLLVDHGVLTLDDVRNDAHSDAGDGAALALLLEGPAGRHFARLAAGGG